MDSAVVFDVPNKLVIPDALHCANVDRHCGIFAWNRTLVVHSSNPLPQASAPLIQEVYASIHSALANKFDVVVVDVVVPVTYVDIVGIRRAALPITLGRAVAAYAAGKHAKIATKLIDFFSKNILSTPLFMIYYITKYGIDKEKTKKSQAKITGAMYPRIYFYPMSSKIHFSVSISSGRWDLKCTRSPVVG